VPHERCCLIDVRVQRDHLDTAALQSTQGLDRPDAAHGRFSTVGDGEATDGLEIGQSEDTPDRATKALAEASGMGFIVVRFYISCRPRSTGIPI
jgi:hypothetical protein